MPGATSDRVDLAYVAEVTWGSTPATPTLTALRFTGESLDKNITTETSQEIRADRAETDLIPVDASVGGGVQFELTYGTFDDWLAALLMADPVGTGWTDSAVSDDFTTVAAPTDNITAATPGAFDGVVPGQVIELVGFVDTSINTRFRVVDKADSQTLTLSPQPAAEVGSGTSLKGQYLTNGVLERSFSVVKRLNDANPVTTRLFNGMRVGSMSLDLSVASRITGEFSLLGKDAVYGLDPAVVGESRPAASSTPIMSSVSNIDSLTLDGTGLCATGSLSSVSFNVDNQHREQKGLCNLGNVGIAAGRLMVTFSGSQYFVNADEANKFENSTAFSFSFAFLDGDGNFYDVNLPKCKYETYTVVAGGINTDIMADISARALLDSAVTGKVIVMSRIPAA